MTRAEKLTAIAENQQKVYEAGKATGVKSEYDRFWDSYQDNGNRVIYSCGFAGDGWNNETFKPKYNIKVKSDGGYMLFRNSNIEGKLPEILSNINKALDLTECISLNYAFQNVLFTRVGECVSNAAAWDQAFASATKLETIDSVKSSTGVFTKLTNTFQNCKVLKDITFNGEIQCNIDLHWSTGLTNPSLKSILSALTKDEAIASGKTCTLPKVLEATIQANTELKDLYDWSVFSGWTFVFS